MLCNELVLICLDYRYLLITVSKWQQLLSPSISACYYARNVYLTVCLIGPNGAILAIRVLRVKRQLSRCILRITQSPTLASLS